MQGPDLMWQDVKELVVGRIRNKLEWYEPDGENTVLSLNLLPAHYIQPNDDRYSLNITHIDGKCSVYVCVW